MSQHEYVAAALVGCLMGHVTYAEWLQVGNAWWESYKLLNPTNVIVGPWA